MTGRALKRYRLEGAAKILIAIGLLLLLFAWIVGIYYYGSIGRITLFIVPFIFTCVVAMLLLVIRYRYTLFEKYPYVMNLPSLFYSIGGGKDNNKQSIAFSMIFTVHAIVIAFTGLLSLVLTLSVGSGIKSSAASPFLYMYLAIIAILVVSVLLQYRRIYIKFAK